MNIVDVVEKGCSLKIRFRVSIALMQTEINVAFVVFVLSPKHVITHKKICRKFSRSRGPAGLRQMTAHGYFQVYFQYFRSTNDKNTKGEKEREINKRHKLYQETGNIFIVFILFIFSNVFGFVFVKPAGVSQISLVELGT